MIYLILALYIAFTFFGSLVGLRKRENTPESYFLANRNLKTVALFFTILATNFSAFYFIGFAGEGYRIGYAYYFVIAFGTSFAAASIYILGSKVLRMGKQHGYITPAELIYGQSKSKTLRYLFALIMVVYTLPYLALQIVGGGYILENLTQGQIPYGWAIVALTIFTIIYVLIGGMISVAKTDLKQGLLAILLMLLAVIVICQKLGGMEYANKLLYQSSPELFDIGGTNDYYTPQKWFSFTVFWFFCIPMFPQLFMRFYIAKSPGHFKKSVLMYAAIPIIISIFPVIIGVLGHITFPGLEGREADQILPMMLLEHTHPYVGALIMVGAVAAFMSTLDSQLLALSTILTRDFYIPLTGLKLSFGKEVFVGRIFVAILSIIGLIIAFNPFDTIFDMGKLAFAGLSILFPAAIAYIKWGGVNAKFGIISIIAGQILLIGFYYELLPVEWLLGFESFIPILFVCFVVILIGILFKPKERSLIKKIAEDHE